MTSKTGSATLEASWSPLTNTTTVASAACGVHPEVEAPSQRILPQRKGWKTWGKVPICR